MPPHSSSTLPCQPAPSPSAFSTRRTHLIGSFEHYPDLIDLRNSVKMQIPHMGMIPGNMGRVLPAHNEKCPTLTSPTSPPLASPGGTKAALSATLQLSIVVHRGLGTGVWGDVDLQRAHKQIRKALREAEAEAEVEAGEDSLVVHRNGSGRRGPVICVSF
ncbi:hypothetical protein M422DRAFT_275553 [Sphaerobolus stellatus SS14]|uniref:Uncharacterized protein n=1 Tax=Sphaerobolus stellatus (strain SS14) TaxID=990650 RepID=A0A0C9UEA0_SPHS4|nr:hypothetical protein M422DRAFT_275553 [Sphaerobolus stellatus SS14]